MVADFSQRAVGYRPESVGEQDAEAGAVLKRSEVAQYHADYSGERAVDKSCQRVLRARAGVGYKENAGEEQAACAQLREQGYRS